MQASPHAAQQLLLARGTVGDGRNQRSRQVHTCIRALAVLEGHGLLHADCAHHGGRGDGQAWVEDAAAELQAGRQAGRRAGGAGGGQSPLVGRCAAAAAAAPFCPRHADAAGRRCAPTWPSGEHPKIQSVPFDTWVGGGQAGWHDRPGGARKGQSVAADAALGALGQRHTASVAEPTPDPALGRQAFTRLGTCAASGRAGKHGGAAAALEGPLPPQT